MGKGVVIVPAATARREVMSATSIGARESVLRGFQQLVVDAVELAGSVSPALKTELVSILGPAFPSEIVPTIGEQKASLPAVLRMLEFARFEAARTSTLRNVRRPLDICVAVLVDRANCGQFGATRKIH